MKKLSFIFLIFISILKVEGVSYTSNYYYEHTNKADIECVQTPPKYTKIIFNHNNSKTAHLNKHSGLNKNILISHKFSLLYFNIFITNQFIVQKHKNNSVQQFIKSLRKKIYPLPADKDPFQLS